MSEVHWEVGVQTLIEREMRRPLTSVEQHAYNSVRKWLGRSDEMRRVIMAAVDPDAVMRRHEQ